MSYLQCKCNTGGEEEEKVRSKGPTSIYRAVEINGEDLKFHLHPYHKQINHVKSYQEQTNNRTHKGKLSFIVSLIFV